MKQIDSVPASITREQLLALIEGAGFVAKDVRGLDIRRNGVYAEVFERGPGGGVRTDGGGPATNRVFVPIEG